MATQALIGGNRKRVVSSKCSMCGKSYTNQEDNFPYTASVLYKHNNYRATICYNCLANELYPYYFKEFGNANETMRRICMHIDVYYSDTIVNTSAVAKKSKPIEKIKAYISHANLVSYKGKTFDTTIDEEEGYTYDKDDVRTSLTLVNKRKMATQITSLTSENDNLKAEITSLKDEVDTLRKSAELKNLDSDEAQNFKNWGEGLSPSDYKVLNAQYQEWVEKNIVEDKTREVLVRKICILSLLSDKALKEGNFKEYNDINKCFVEALKLACLSPQQMDDMKTSEGVTYGTLIKRFEQDEPLPEISDKFKDVDGIVRYITVYFIGHLCAMLGIKNRFSDDYHKEMEKYKTMLDGFENSTSEEIFDYLSEKGFPTEIGGEDDSQ